jgi:hypothetical protein
MSIFEHDFHDLIVSLHFYVFIVEDKDGQIRDQINLCLYFSLHCVALLTGHRMSFESMT